MNKNNPKNSSATKVRKHIPSGFLMYTISSFRSIKNKQTKVKVYAKVKVV